MILYIVVPCFNEEEGIVQSAERLNGFLAELMEKNRISSNSKIVFVNDGSRDKTKELLENICKNNISCSLISFSRNFGHQYAVLAGYHFSKDKCDACISIDADLQQDINAIYDFLDCYEKGNDIVYGVRNDRNTDGFFKKSTSQIFYRFMSKMGCEVIPNHADYRLLSKKALNELSHYPEGAVFLRGLIPTMGMKSDIVYFDVFERTAGQSKYTMKKMLKLAMDGITSFSDKPVFAILKISLISIVISIVLFIINAIITPEKITMVLFALGFLFSGLIELCIWIIGVYVVRTYLESKNRPRYIIESVIHEVNE